MFLETAKRMTQPRAVCGINFELHVIWNTTPKEGLFMSRISSQIAETSQLAIQIVGAGVSLISTNIENK